MSPAGPGAVWGGAAWLEVCLLGGWHGRPVCDFAPFGAATQGFRPVF